MLSNRWIWSDSAAAGRLGQASHHLPERSTYITYITYITWEVRVAANGSDNNCSSCPPQGVRAVRLLNMHLLARSFRIAHPTRIDRCRTGIARTKAPLRFYTKVVAGIVVVFFFIIFARTGAWRFINARVAIHDEWVQADISHSVAS